MELLKFGPVIQREFDFTNFRIKNLTEIVKIEESDEHFATRVTLDYEYNVTWTLYPILPTLKAVSFEATTTGEE